MGAVWAGDAVGGGRRQREAVATRVRELLAAHTSRGLEPTVREDDAGDDASDDDRKVLDSHPEHRVRRRQDAVQRDSARTGGLRRSAIAVAGAALVAAVVTGWWVFSSRPHSVGLPSGSSAPGSGVALSSTALSTGLLSASAPSGSSSSGVVVVDVEGKVRHPGLYRLPAGSRVADAITAAGGVRGHVDTASVNLAAKLADGQQVVVGLPAAPSTSGPGAGDGTASASGPVDLNTASLEQLETLPGVGPVLAQHILDWRTQHGSFGSVSDLNDVTGIGDVKFAELRDLVTV